MGEVSFRYYKRYLKIKLELSTLEEEIRYLKVKQDKMAYSGCKEIKAVNYSNERANSNPVNNTEDISTFYDEFIQLTKQIRVKEIEVEDIKKILKHLEDTFYQYSKECNDLEIKVFIDYYVHNKRINDILIPKPTSSEFYSVSHIKRILKEIRKKIKKEG